MRKIIANLLFVVLFAFITNMAHSQTYFTESFEGSWYVNGDGSTAPTQAGMNAPNGWRQTRVINNVAPPLTCATSGGKDWQQSTWSSGTVWATGQFPAGCVPFGGAPGSVPDGTRALFFYDGWCSSGHTRRIESPSINLSTATSPVISFSYSYAGGGVSNVVGSLDGGTTWNVLSTITATTSGTWVTKVVTIPAAYNIATAKFGFQIASTFGSFDVFIDNVIVREGVQGNAAPNSFSASLVTTTSMTVNWVDNSTNEISFNVYRSTDNVNFTLISNVASTTTATTGTSYLSAQPGLLPGVTYFYRIAAVAEVESPYLTGSQATLAAGVKTSAVSGLWSDPNTWSPVGVPIATDDVTIADGHTVTIDITTAVCNNLTVGQGIDGILTYQATPVAGLNVAGNVTITAGGTFTAGTGTLTTHTLAIGGTATNNSAGSLSNNGTFDMNTTAGVTTTFFGGLNGSVSATGATTDFWAIVVNKGTTQTGAIMDITSVITQNAPTATANRLVITAGTFKMSSASALTPYFGSQTICAATGRLWINNAGASIQCVGTGVSATGAGSPTVTGELRIDDGTFGYGQGNNTMTVSTATGVIRMAGGTLNMFGAISFASNAGTQLIMSAGNINVDVQNVTAAAAGTTQFLIGASTTVNWTGGNITIIDPHAAVGGVAWSATAGGSKIVSGTATLNIGNGVSTTASTAGNTSGFGLLSTMALNNLVINNRTDASTTRMARMTGQVTVAGTITISPNSYLFMGSGTTTQTLLLSGATASMVQNGILAGCEPGGTQSIGTLYSQALLGGAQTMSGSGTFVNTQGINIENYTGSITFSNTNPYKVRRVNLFTGSFNPGANFIIGNNSPATLENPIIQYGSGLVAFASGTFTTFPTLDETEAQRSLFYSISSNTFTMGFNGESSPGAQTLTQLLMNNANGLSIPADRTVSIGGLAAGTLTMALGSINLNGGTLTLGSSATALGTLTYTTGHIQNGTFTRWFGTTASPTTIANGNGGHFPMGDGGNNRHTWLSFSAATALTTGGTVSVMHTNASGTTTIPAFLDGAVNVDTRTNASWAISQSGLVASGTINARIQGSNIAGLFVANVPNLRFIRALDAVATFLPGTNTAADPQINRSAMSVADLANTFYIGQASGDVPFVSVANGNYEDGSTWNKNPLVPTATDNVIIAGATTVTVNATASAALGLTVNNGGTLTVSGSTLGISGTLTNTGTFNASGGTTNVTAAAATGITNSATTGVFNVNGGTVNVGVTDNTACNRTFLNNGILNVSSGNLNIYGNMNSAAGSTFNQTGGTIKADGNAGGVVANSVLTTVPIFRFNNGINTLSGGTIIIVDPHAGAGSADEAFSFSGSANASASTSHTVQFGDGVSTDATTNVNGFLMEPFVGSFRLMLGNLVLNTGTTAGNRHVTNERFTGQIVQVLGDMTINAGSEDRTTAGTLAIAGNLSNAGTLTATGTLAMSSGSGTSTLVASTNAQSIGGAGTFRNLTAAPTANLTGLTINNSNATGVTLNVPLSASGTLTMTAGLINTTSTNLLTLGTATLSGTLSGTPSVTNMIIGPFARTFAASRTATGVYSNTNLFPVGKGASYLPINIDPNTTAGGAVVMTGEAFTTNSGTLAPGTTTLSQDRWEALIASGSLNFTSSFVRLTDGAILSTNKILQAATAAGAYSGIPVASTYAAGPPVTLATFSPLLADKYIGYFAYGDLTNCIAPLNQPTNFGATGITTTSFNGNFTLATSAPSHYLVVRYPAGTLPGGTTPPVDFTSYATGATLGTGTVVTNVTDPANTYTATGLTAATTYEIYIYSYNNSGCFGPAYQINSPLTGTVTTCGANVGAPGTPTSSLITTTSFQASWTASSNAPGVDYFLDVATNPGFTTFVPGYNDLNVGTDILTINVNTGLTPATTYYVRVRAFQSPCISVNSGTLTVTTACNAFSIPYSENFDGVTAPTIPTCTLVENVNGSTTWVNATVNPRSAPNCLTYQWNLNLPGDDWWYTAGLNMTGGTSYRLTFWYRVRSATFPESLEVKYGTAQASGSMTGGTLFSVINTTTTTYTQVVVDFAPASNGVYYIGFHAISDPDQFDLNVDDINVDLSPPCPTPTSVSVGAITSTSASVSFTSPGTSFIVEYGAPGFTPGTGATPGAGGTIVTGAASPITISPLTPGLFYDVYVRQVCAGPIYSGNTAVVSFSTPITVSTFPYCEDYEGAALGWSTAINSGSVNDWVIGTPAKTQISGAHGGTKAYVTLTTGTYNDSQDAYVLSPSFDFSALTIDPKISFWSNFKTELGWDACILEVSTDGGTTWTKLDPVLGTGGTFNTINSLRWYNNNAFSGGPIAIPNWGNSSTAYTGHAAGWINSVSNLVGMKGAGYSNVRFRWRFGSDTSVPDEGWAIDDVCITAVDDVPPAITYTAFSGTSCLTDRTLSATITDGGIGVNNTPGTKPRLYFKKSTDANDYAGNTSANNGWKYVEATNASSPFSFTTDYSLLQSAVATGDIIQYFVVAQDLVATPNVGINSGTFANTQTSVALLPAGAGGAFPIGPTINQYVLGTGFSADLTIGSGGTYPNLTGTGGFFEALNNGTLNANINATIISSPITEPATVALNAITYGGCVAGGPFTLTIKPNTGLAVTLTGSNSTGAIIKLNGADYVTIDGLNTGGSSLSILNTSTATGSAVIWIASASSTDGATNNSIKNCTLQGSGGLLTAVGILGGGGSTFGGPATAPNSNNTIMGNTINNCQNAIYSQGFATSPYDQNWVITNNSFGSAVASEKHGFRGMLIGNASNMNISNNTINGVLSSTGTGGAMSGIMVAFATSGGQISNNIFRDIKNQSTFGTGALAINLSQSSATANLNVFNNMIFDVAGNGSATVASNSHGIYVATGGGYNIWYNSVHLNTDQFTGAGTTAGMYIAAAIPAGGLDVRDNIFANTQGTGTRYSIYSAAPNTVFSSINHNDYYSNGSVGFLGGAQATLANWQTATGQDAQSIAADPNFISLTDLHINTSLASPIDAAGTPIGAVALDIDGNTRNVTTPDIGADEVTINTCTGAVGGTATGSTSFCTSGTPTITASGYSTGIGSTYQWMTSTLLADYPLGGSAVPGETNPATLSTGLVSTTTYYWLKVTCTSGTAVDYSNLITITINTPPTAAITPAGPISICPPTTSQLLTASTNSGSPSYVWKKNGITIPSETNPTYTATTTGTYTVVVTDGVTLCSSTSNAVVVTFNLTPAAPVVTPATPQTICLGASQALTANTVPGAGTIISQDFEGGIGTWTITASSSGGTNPALANFTIRPHGWVGGSSPIVTFNSPGATNFILADPDAAGSGVFFSTTLTSPSFSTAGYASMDLNYRHFYVHLTSPATVEVSTDGGTVWTTVQTHSTSQGASTSFAPSTIGLNAYLGLPDVRVRFSYSGGWLWHWAIDDIAVTGTPTSYNYSWTATPAANAGLPAGAGTPAAGNSSISATPTAVGTYTYTAYTTDPATGCISAGTTTAVITVSTPANAGTVTGTTPLCIGQSATYTSNGDPGGTWTSTNTGVATVHPTSGLVTAVALGTTDITYTVTSCSGPLSAFQTLNVTACAPPNDDAPGAITLTLGAGCAGSPYTNAGATQGGSEPFAACQGTAGFKTVWYKFTAPASGAVKISSDFTGGTMGEDSRLALYATTDVNNYAVFSSLACDDNNGTTDGGTRSVLYYTGLTSGTTYYIQVDGKDGSTAAGTFCLTVDDMTSAMVATSTACAAGQDLTSVNNNYTGWLSATDANGNLVALIRNPAGSGTSTYSNSININAAAVRTDVVSNQKYLDRNYTINNAAVTNVDVRFFFLNTELAALQAADPGVTLANLQATRQTGTVCDNDFVAANGTNSSIAQSGNGSGAGFSWIQLNTPAFSKFTLHTKKGYAPVKTWLQGAYSVALLRHKNNTAAWVNVLNANALTQPYNVPGFGNYAGTESVSAGFFVATAATTDVTDWVLLELRDATTPATVITRRAAFIREDGRIVDLDGVSNVSFRNIPDGNYFYVIRHRNHLLIRSSVVRPLTTTMGVAVPAVYDFSTSLSQAFDNVANTVNDQMVNVGGGVFGMMGGNANGSVGTPAAGNATIRASGGTNPLVNDYVYLVTTVLGGNVNTPVTNVYHTADLNMDGTVRANGGTNPAVNDYIFLITTALGGNSNKVLTHHQ